MTSSTGDPGSGGGGLAVWFRRQEPAIKAALITLIGSLCVALLGATVTVTVALLNRPKSSSAAPGGTNNVIPSSSSPAPDVPDTPVSTPPSPTPSPHPPKPTPTPTPTPSPTPTSVPLPAPPRTRWHGTLTLDGTAGVRGWFMDDTPPARAPMGDIAIRGPQEVYDPYALAAWNASAPPGAQECSDLLNSNPGQQQLDVQPGDMACFTTEQGRTGYLTVTATRDADHITIEATVWQQQ
jgi:hypothetical protein